MSDNRTAEQILKDHGLGNSTVYSVTTPNGYSYSTIDAMEEYASQQTASLREENEKLKSEAKEQYSAGLMCERILAKDQIKQLQEEVERLRGLLKNVLPMAEDGYTLHKKNGSHQEFLSEDRELLQSIREALSSKESKPS